MVILLNILYVVPNEDFDYFLVEDLEKKKIFVEGVTIAQSSSEAQYMIENCEEGRFNLFLIHTSLPGSTGDQTKERMGFALSKWMKENYSNIPVCGIKGKRSRFSVEEVSDSRIDSILEKPVSAEEIIEKVRELMGRQ
jgi:DNA-binding NarL/FixJ family response regulator